MIMPLDHDVIRERPFTIVPLNRGVIREILSQLCHYIEVLSEILSRVCHLIVLLPGKILCAT